MVTIVLVLNVGLAVLCLVVAWQVYRISKILRKIAMTLTAIEKSTHGVLYRAPETIMKGQVGAEILRQRIDNLPNLPAQVQQLSQILGLISLGRKRWSSTDRRKK
jgi:uncharacterized protein YoxC